MDMLEFEKNRRKKKEKSEVNHINVNSSINKKDFINYNPLNNKFVPSYLETLNQTQSDSISTLEENFNSETIERDPIGSTSKNEGTAIIESTFKNDRATKHEGPFDNEGSTKSEGTSKLKAPKNIKINLNSIERTKVSLDSLRIEQIVKQVISESMSDEVVIGRRVFENNGVNTSRFTSAREETRDRGIIEYEKKKDKNGIEHTWYKLK